MALWGGRNYGSYMKILLLEDDTEIGSWTRDGLTQSGHVVDWLKSGRDALIAATTQDYDLLIMDRMVPDLDGLSVLRAIRAAKNATPVLLLTALGDVDDRVEGLQAGADDYLPKPFAFSELDARVAALGRRNADVGQATVTQLIGGDIHLDLLKQRCTRQGQTIDLSAKEFRLLEAFLRSGGRVLTRNMLLEKVWDMNFDPTTSVVETHISRLRGKIEKPFGDMVIRTMRGVGYVFDPAV
jgi:DNA-binding response OmpR family regulator